MLQNYIRLFYPILLIYFVCIIIFLFFKNISLIVIVIPAAICTLLIFAIHINYTFNDKKKVISIELMKNKLTILDNENTCKINLSEITKVKLNQYFDNRLPWYNYYYLEIFTTIDDSLKISCLKLSKQKLFETLNPNCEIIEIRRFIPFIYSSKSH